MASGCGRALWMAVLMLVMLVSPSAQSQKLPTRPSLPRDADRNDWEVYYDAGFALLSRDATAADDAFVWASRLRPDLGEPLYARWVSFWARDIDRFERYLRDDEVVLREPAVVRIDSLKRAAVGLHPSCIRAWWCFSMTSFPGSSATTNSRAGG